VDEKISLCASASLREKNFGAQRRRGAEIVSLGRSLYGTTHHIVQNEIEMIRDDIKAAQISAMKAGEKDRLAAVRLILAKLKDRDIELRTASQQPEDNALVVEVLQKMAKQRRESIAMYEQGGRQELADVEKGELQVIESFMPAQMGEDDTMAAIEAIKAELGASGMKDMGRVIAELKARHGTSLDMGKASGLVKAALV
jgi:uncharacterized protein